MKTALALIYSTSEGVEAKHQELTGLIKMTEVANKVAKLTDLQGGSLYDSYGGALWVGLTLAAVQQLTGINIVIYYAPVVFQTQGATTAKALALVMSLVNFIFTFGSLFFADSNGPLAALRTRPEDLACGRMHRLRGGTARVHHGLWWR